MTRIFQVEYMIRPDETEHIEQFDDLRKACKLAREMSDKHDTGAVVVVLDDPPSNSDLDHLVIGHIEFMFGMVKERVGSMKRVKVPR